jgi:cell pole-organizing protein PopZ
MRQMNQPAKAQEPSMEEILASIRRIIADDDAAKSPPSAPEPVKSAPVHATPAPLRPGPSLPSPLAARAAPAPRSEPLKEAEREEKPAPAPPRSAPPPAEELASDVLDLTEAMSSPPPLGTPGFQTIDGQPDVVFDDSSPEPVEPPSQGQSREGRERMLMSPATSAAVDSAFNTLAHTVLVQNARTLEDLVREMLAPLLKTWLDDNLPGLVERLVRAEIERVSRGRG